MPGELLLLEVPTLRVFFLFGINGTLQTSPKMIDLVLDFLEDSAILTYFAVDFYSDEDIFLIMEMEFGGQDLESFRVESAEQVYSIIMQLIYALELAETKLKFEHRDLYIYIYLSLRL